MREKRMTFSGSSLKIIAMVSMVIDHISVVIIGRMIANMEFSGSGTGPLTAFSENCPAIGNIYFLMRLAGRPAFPIYIFLLIEGVKHTRNIYRYAFRLLLFSGISEVPFDLAIRGKIIDFSCQNVFFTLFLGLCSIICIRLIEKMRSPGKILKSCFIILAVILFCFTAEAMHTDYGAAGVLAVTGMYLMRNRYLNEILTGCGILTVFTGMEITSFASVPFVIRYNGTRGLNNRYLFYIFYPAHLLILYFIARGMGIAG